MHCCCTRSPSLSRSGVQDMLVLDLASYLGLQPSVKKLVAFLIGFSLNLVVVQDQ